VHATPSVLVRFSSQMVKQNGPSPMKCTYELSLTAT
jgi:hypothetical protein